MMKGLKITLCFLVLCAHTILGFCAAGDYHFHQISGQNGLSSGIKSVAVSECDGSVWMGSDNGIGHFDGYDLDTYIIGDARQILEDAKNRIWAICPQGVLRYNEATDSFDPAMDSNGNPVKAHSMCLCKDGLLFGGRGVVHKLTYSTGKLIALHTIAGDYSIERMEMWNEDFILASNETSPAVLIEERTGKVVPFPVQSTHISAFYRDKAKNLVWLSSYNQGLSCYDGNGKLLKVFNSSNSGLKTNIILSLTEREGKIWIATDGDGIYVLTPENGNLEHLTHIPGNPDSLPENSILCLSTDKNENVWAGSVRGGLLNIKENRMTIYRETIPGTNYGLSTKTVLCLHQDYEDRIWIGTDGGGLNAFHPAEGEFEHIQSTYGDKVASMTSADESHLLLSLFSKGLYLYDIRNKTSRPLIIVNEEINSSMCKEGKTVNVYKVSDRKILLLSKSSYEYDIVSGSFTPMQMPETQMLYGQMLPIRLEGGKFIFHDERAIYDYDTASGKTGMVFTNNGKCIFNSISPDAEDDLWIGTDLGLARYRPGDKDVSFVETGLFKEVKSVICDDNNCVWLGTNDKLFSYDIIKKEFVLYGESDGVSDNQYLIKPRLKSFGGDIYMGGVNGLLQVQKSKLESKVAENTELVLKDVNFSGKRVIDSAVKDRRIKFKDYDFPVEIHIASVNKDIFYKPMYRYTISGSIDNVTYSYSPSCAINVLPVGSCTLKAAYITRNGGWSKDFEILEVDVRPPWYKSFPAVLLYIIFLSAFVLLVIKSIIKRKERKLSKMMEAKEKEVNEEKVRYLININHELRTPLTLIYSPLKQLLSSTADAASRSLVQLVYKQSKRMRNLLDMVLDVGKMEMEQSTLVMSRIKTRPWIDDIVSDFKTEADYRNIAIKLEYDSEGLPDSLTMDKEKITIVMTNLLINALKYSPEGSTITISVKPAEEGSNLRVSIADEGPGLKGVDYDSLFDRFYQGKDSKPGTGIGLSYSKILVEQHGGRIGAFDNEGGPGSTFWIELPDDLEEGKLAIEPRDYLNELLAPSDANGGEEGSGIKLSDYSVLLVDDNQDLTEYLDKSFSKVFKSVYKAYDGKAALDLCVQAKPDIIISDIQMPVMNGFELCKQVKETLEISHIPVVLLTAMSDSRSKIFGYKNGADAYITKPFEIDVLLSLVQNILSRREENKSRFSKNGVLPLPEESTYSPADESFLARMNRLIKENISNSELGIPFICKEMGMSRASLYNKMRAITNMGTNDYITKIRIEESFSLLLETNDNINEISDKVGFSSSRYFSTVFKQYTGCTPSQYKASHRRK